MDKKLKKIFSKIIGIKESSIKPRTSPKNTKKWDSLAHMNLVMALENELKIKFTDNEITEMLTFELVREIIVNKKSAKYID
jgi:acyl carrier protein|tara:strand:- start:151 stop:393 length:243 start_codon:yes stop_codon:yes gene_type:complete